MPKLTDKTELTNLSDNDLAHVVDVSDVTSGASGTSKKITYTNIFAQFLAAARTMAATFTMSGAAINEADYVIVASASTCDIGAAASNNVAISGTTTINSFGTANAGITRRCRATGAFKLTYNATSLITSNAKDIVTKADDCFTMTSLGSGNWIMTSYKPADGRALANAIDNQTGTTYTQQLTNAGNNVTLSNASAITVTLPQNSNIAFPIGSETWYTNLGAGLATFVKEGSEGLLGNVTLAQYQSCKVKRIDATTWQIFAGTATVNLFGSHLDIATITTSQTITLVGYVGAPSTLLGIYQKARALTTAGTFAIKKNGTTLSGLGSIVPSTAGSYTTATGTGSDNVLARGDQITIVADGTLVGVLDLALSLDLTMQF